MLQTENSQSLTTEDSDFQGDSRAKEERTPVAFGGAINQLA